MELSSDTKLRSSLMRVVRYNENGVALVIGLMFVAILAMVGTTAVVMTTTDIKIGANHKTSVQAFNAGQAGTEEARARLAVAATNYVGENLAASPNPLWSAYILTSDMSTSDDPNFDGAYTNNTNTSLQSDSSYLVKIRHKREYDAEQAGHTTGTPHYADGDGSLGTNPASSPGNIIYYGDDPATPNTAEWVDFTASATPSAKVARPVEILRAYGSKGNALDVIEIEVKCAPLGIDADSVLYAKDNVTGNGAALTVNANGPTGCPSSATNTIYTYSTPTAPTTTTLNGTPTLLPPPGTPVAGTHNVEITDMVDSLSGHQDETITSDQTGITYGSSTNFLVCYSDTSDPPNVQGLKLQGVTGWGLLLVKGDLTLGGGFTWNGLILVTGVLAFNGGAGINAINISGAVMANQTVAINGSINLQYNSCYITNALGSASPKTASWKEVY